VDASVTSALSDANPNLNADNPALALVTVLVTTHTHQIIQVISGSGSGQPEHSERRGTRRMRYTLTFDRQSGVLIGTSGNPRALDLVQPNVWARFMNRLRA
jgi:hypothetical protein